MMGKIGILSALLILFSCFGYLHPELRAAEKSSETDYCMECHKGLSGPLKAAVDDWKKSRHSMIGTCNICHQGNSGINDKRQAKAPGSGYIGRPDRRMNTEFCGRGGCHSEQINNFKIGPHYRLMPKEGKPDCLSCHGFHGIVTPSSGIIKETACIKCHSREDFGNFTMILGNMEKGMVKVSENIDYLKSKSIDVVPYQKRYVQSKTFLSQFVHSMSKEDIKSTRKIIELQIENLSRETSGLYSLTKRLDIFYIIIVSFGLIVIAGISIYTFLTYIQRK